MPHPTQTLTPVFELAEKTPAHYGRNYKKSKGHFTTKIF
jgi:hypothetical protein